MKVYVGQTRSRKLLEELSDLGFGEMTVRGEYPPYRRPWAYDNGAFRDYSAEKPFNETTFEFEIQKMAMSVAHPPPDFIILPDIVAGGLESLMLSVSWVPKVMSLWTPNRPLPPLYLAVQDGMEFGVVESYLHIHEIGGLFVGGSTEWKEKTGSRWCDLAHDNYKLCHIGRVGTPGRVAWGFHAGADSVDSCFPLWTEERMAEFVRAFRALFPPQQAPLPGFEGA